MLNNEDNTNKVITGAQKQEMEQALCHYIVSDLLPPNCGLTVKPDDDLLGIGYLDSMQFIRLVQHVEETYSVKISPEDLLIENFQTVQALTSYLGGQLNTATEK